MRRYIFSTLLSLAVASSCLAVCAEDEKKDGAADAKPAADAAAGAPASAPATKPAKAAKPAKVKKAKAAKPADSDAKKADAKPASSDAKKSDAKASSDGGGAGGIASHVASFVAGTFVGIPVQIWRKSKQESIQATRDLVGDTDKKWLTGAAAVLGVPAGILSGTVQAMVYGPLDAYRGTKDEPFSPEAFSLGDSK